MFILDTGASYVSVKSAFAEGAKISVTDASEITLITANGQAKAKLSKADKIALGTLQATAVPVAVQNGNENNYDPGHRRSARLELLVALRGADCRQTLLKFARRPKSP